MANSHPPPFCRNCVQPFNIPNRAHGRLTCSAVLRPCVHVCVCVELLAVMLSRRAFRICSQKKFVLPKMLRCARFNLPRQAQRRKCMHTHVPSYMRQCAPRGHARKSHTHIHMSQTQFDRYKMRWLGVCVCVWSVCVCVCVCVSTDAFRFALGLRRKSLGLWRRNTPTSQSENLAGKRAL